MCYSLADVVVGNHKNCLYYKRKEKEKNFLEKKKKGWFYYTGIKNSSIITKTDRGQRWREQENNEKERERLGYIKECTMRRQ